MRPPSNADLQQIRDDEHDRRMELIEAETAYVEAAADLALCEERFQTAWAEKNGAQNVYDTAAKAYRAAFEAVHGCELPKPPPVEISFTNAAGLR